MSEIQFFLGTHRPTWLWTVSDVPLFISHRVLRERKTPFPAATTDWALDSGGFTELNLFGEWRTTPEEYVTFVRRYVNELGRLAWASPQDWMCEPWVLEKTGLTVAEHQQRTVENYLTLRKMAPDLPFIPVLQGWELADYHAHADAYAAAGVDLTSQPVVGIGSVCRRQATGQIAGIFDSLQARGLRMHGFGVKSQGLALYAGSARLGRLARMVLRGTQGCPGWATNLRQEVLQQLPSRRAGMAGSGAADARHAAADAARRCRMNPWAFCSCGHIGVSHAITGTCVVCPCCTYVEEGA